MITEAEWQKFISLHFTEQEVLFWEVQAGLFAL